MLQLRPNCELCDKDLAPESSEARICSYECTFCQACVEQILENVCPNCGGGFTSRPIRPKTARRAGVSLIFHEASHERVVTKYSQEDIQAFAQPVKAIDPSER